MLALTRLQLEALDVVDIGVRREHSSHVAARPAVRIEVDAYPERVALDRGELPLEADALSGQRGLEIRVIELVELAAVDLDNLAPDDLGLRLAGPVEKRPVDEAVALVHVDIADGQAERVQLALRQRQQGFPLHPLAHGLLRRVIEPGQGSW